MIDFATLQGLTIHEGVVTQITDASGRVLWAVSGGKAVLQVEKFTSNTYAGETTYTGEQFILLDIYPKTNRTVKVTYGGLTKTITDTSGAAEPNAQQVVFGTFNGVVHDTTPTSGELTIEGDFYAFGCGAYSDGNSSTDKLASDYCSCITAVVEWGNITKIPSNAFQNCDKLNISAVPEGVVSIGTKAFSMSYNSDGWVTPMSGGVLTLPSTLQSIGDQAFTTNYSYTISGTTQVASVYPCYLGKVILLSTTPPTITLNTFFSTTPTNFIGPICVVPKGCGDIYKEAPNWSTAAMKIIEEE